MKKMLFLGLMCLVCVSASAKVRDAQDAARIAQQFVSTRTHANVRQNPCAPVQLVQTITQDSLKPAIYVFSKGEEAGCIFVSADDQTRSVLGYTNDGTWNEDSIPTNVSLWIQHYVEEVASLHGNVSTSNQQDCRAIPANGYESNVVDNDLHAEVSVAESHFFTQQAQNNQIVNPLLGDITWNQTKPYNNNCPIDPDNSSQHCYTGCVATAAAQIMRFWNHPSSGTGSHSYYWEYGKKTLSASFAHTYNWTNMLPDYSSNYTSAQASAVAKLMSDVGIAAEMEYGGETKGGSGASVSDMAIAMQEHFDYDKCMWILNPAFIGQAAFESAVEDEIQSGRPLLMRGQTITDGGHCFICDGIDSNGLFHINWGWGGYLDGYFALSALDPNRPGASGSASKNGYSINVNAIRYILPNKGYGANLPQLGTTDVSFDKYTYNVGDSINVTVQSIENYGLTDWNGNIKMVIADSDRIVSTIGNVKVDYSLKSEYYYINDFVFSGTLPSLADGTYTMAPIYSVDGEWYYIDMPREWSLIVQNRIGYLTRSGESPTTMYYTSSDGNIVTPFDENAFDANIISNTYDDGQGVMVFNGTLTNIGMQAFAYTSLSTINIPNSVTTIGSYAFEYSDLESITIPESVESIKYNAFSGCYNLAATHISNLTSWCQISFDEYKANPLYYAKRLFLGETELTNIHLPNEVMYIQDYAFVGYENLLHITYPNTLQSIGEGAFMYCNGLKAISIPNSVSSIGQYAFACCSNLDSITIPANVTDVDESVLLYCPNLSFLACPVECLEQATISYQQEYYPKHLKKVVINAGELTENSLSVINLSYKTLKVIDVSATANTSLSDEAFKGCYNLDTLYFPSQLEQIPYMAAAGCKNMHSIYIPTTVVEIGQSAFDDCRSLQSVIFGNQYSKSSISSLQKINNWAFYNAHELQNITIPEGVEEIGDAAFYGCTYLQRLSLPSSVKSIGDHCFALCSKLDTIHVDATTPPVIQSKTFFDVNRKIPVFVPDEAVATYKADNLWGEFNIQGINTPEGVENTSTAKKEGVVNKYIIDGHLYILRDGKTYTVQGVMVDER